MVKNKHSNAELLVGNVRHERLHPRQYSFDFKLFWFKVRINPEAADQQQSFFAGFYKLRVNHHLNLGKPTLWGNIAQFLRDQEIDSPVHQIDYYGNLAVAGYVFNPVCFFLCTLSNGGTVAIIQIGNTFNELKPVVVRNVQQSKGSDLTFFNTSFRKNFYVSPFVRLDSEMTFRWRRSDEMLTVSIMDEVNTIEGGRQRVLQTNMSLRAFPYKWWRLLLLSIRFPLITIQTITMIHWHAFRLWLSGVPFIRKNENPELQQGVYPWKARKS